MLGRIKIVRKRKKRLGRGYGSGKGGHTSSRGQKGQKSRRKLGALFEGVKVKKSFIKRLPLLRGKGKLKARLEPVIIKASSLNILPESSVVDENLLVRKGLVKKSDIEKRGVKIVGGGKLEKNLIINLPKSASVLKQLEALAKK